MVEGRVDHRVGPDSTTRDDVRVLEHTPKYFGAGLLEPLRTVIRSSEPQHLMAGTDKLGHDPRTNEAGRAGQKDTHGNLQA